MEIQVLAVGKCCSDGGRMVIDGIGWKPSSLAGKDGEPVQKKRSSCLWSWSKWCTTHQNHRLNSVNFSAFTKDWIFNVFRIKALKRSIKI